VRQTEKQTVTAVNGWRRAVKINASNLTNQKTSSCLTESLICNRSVAGSNLGRGYFVPRSAQPSIPPEVGKWVPSIAGKAKTGMAHSDCGWACRCAGKTVRSLENACASAVVIQYEEALYQVHAPLPLPLRGISKSILNIEIHSVKSSHLGESKVVRTSSKTVIRSFGWKQKLMRTVLRVELRCMTYQLAISVCLFSCQTTALHNTCCHPLHHTLHHQLTDCQRSEKIRPAAATTNRLSWWSVCCEQILHNIHVTITQWKDVQFLHFAFYCRNSVVMRADPGYSAMQKLSVRVSQWWLFSFRHHLRTQNRVIVISIDRLSNELSLHTLPVSACLWCRLDCSNILLCALQSTRLARLRRHGLRKLNQA